MKKIRIAQYGIGHNHGAEKMKAFRKFPELFEVVGVCEPDEAWRAKRQNDPAYEGLTWLTEEELFSMTDLDAVSVETDVKDLNKGALLCVQHGWHIHMDKPAGEKLEEFAEILSIAKEKKLIVQMGYMYRYNPVIRHAIDLAKSGELGEIFEIDTQMSTAHPVEYRKWLTQFGGSGPMYIFGCHLLDLILQVLGPDYTKITSYVRKTKPEEADLEDNALAVVEYPKATCTVRTSSVEINGYGRRQLVICGTKGTVEIKPLERPSTISVSFAKDNPPSYQDSRQFLQIEKAEGRYDEQVQEFAECIRGERENPYTYEHELALQKATLEACGIL